MYRKVSKTTCGKPQEIPRFVPKPGTYKVIKLDFEEHRPTNFFADCEVSNKKELVFTYEIRKPAES